MAISIDLSGFKSAGVYTVEIDNSTRESASSPRPYRLVVGFGNKGPFNRPVLLTSEKERASVFGDIDLKLEHKGCFFNRALKTSLTTGPVLALNLLKTDDKINGADQVNWAAMSLDAGAANPSIGGTTKKYGQYDYNTGDLVPFIGQTPFATLYNRSRFWIPDKDMLTAVASSKLTAQDVATYETSNLLNFANVGTEELSILVYKPTNISGYDVTCEQWYGSKDKIPFGWIRPYDLVSDYFITVICVKGNWTNYPVLATDPVWGEYFDKTGIKKNKVANFISAEGVSVIGSWTGVIIPDFIDKQGNLLYIEKRINNTTEKTGLLMSFNKDALQVINWDLTGEDNAGGSEEDKGKAFCGLDIDGNGEIESGQGETEAKYQIDMVGHNAFVTKYVQISKYDDTSVKDGSISAYDTSVYVKDITKLYRTPGNLICVKKVGVDVSMLSKTGTWINASTGTYMDASVFNFDPSTDKVATDELKNCLRSYYILDADRGFTAYSATPISQSITVIDSSNATAEYEVLYGKHKVKIDASLNTNGIYVTKIHNVAIYNSTVENSSTSSNNIKFLSYNYISTNPTTDGILKPIKACYFNSSTFWSGETPVDKDTKNMFIITDVNDVKDEAIKVGDYVLNIAYDNEPGVAAENNIIPGVTRVLKKNFIQVDKSSHIATYKGKKYFVNEIDKCYEVNNNFGFYLITTTAAVKINTVGGTECVQRQLPISDDRISGILKFIPMKGLEITSRHRPGFDENGNLSIEGGIEKIYSVLKDEGIHRGLTNRNLHEYRYIVDTMSYGIGAEMGGKVYLSKLAKERGKCLAVLSLPSAKQFGVSSNPYFCDTYISGTLIRPGLNTKYIPEGGNTEMGSTVLFTLPSMDNGADYTACFFPHLVYKENGREFSVPAAADCCNVLYRKFTGVADPYGICANNTGILSNNYISGLEYECDQTDRDYLEPFGVNCVIKEAGAIMIYGNQTAYQSVKSDKNKLHVRENLNTLEIECDAICRRFNFLYNTAAVRAELVSQFTSVLQVMQVSGAIDTYTITCDETNNTREVIEADCGIIDVEVVMNHGMEKIIQRFTLNRRSED